MLVFFSFFLQTDLIFFSESIQNKINISYNITGLQNVVCHPRSMYR